MGFFEKTFAPLGLRRIQDEVLAEPQDRDGAPRLGGAGRLGDQVGHDAFTTAGRTSAARFWLSISDESTGSSCCPVRRGSTGTGPD